MNDLTLLATGLHGKDLLPQNGAPIRLVVPWKYGFKSIKSIVKIDLVAEHPDARRLVDPRQRRGDGWPDGGRSRRCHPIGFRGLQLVVRLPGWSRCFVRPCYQRAACCNGLKEHQKALEHADRYANLLGKDGDYYVEVDGEALMSTRAPGSERALAQHAARALARTLSGEATALSYPAMPVVVKTPAHPVVVASPASAAEGSWLEEALAHGVRARFVSGDGRLLGFALTGGAAAEKQALTKQLPPILS